MLMMMLVSLDPTVATLALLSNLEWVAVTMTTTVSLSHLFPITTLLLAPLMLAAIMIWLGDPQCKRWVAVLPCMLNSTLNRVTLSRMLTVDTTEM